MITLREFEFNAPRMASHGFISYAVRYGGVFFIEYEWVEKEYAEHGYDDMLFQQGGA